MLTSLSPCRVKETETLRSRLNKHALNDYASIHSNKPQAWEAMKPFVTSGVDTLLVYMKLEGRPARKPRCGR